jgi:2'-5' RNA ligase
MSDLTAIDILINPDENTVERARAFNARLRQSVPSGFELDATHLPHITILQRYVRTADLEKVYEAIQKTIAETDMSLLKFRAVAIKHADWVIPGQGYLTVYSAKPSPEVIDFQAKLITTVKPFVEPGGTAAAYVTNTSDPEINQATLTYVEQYVPNSSGSNYIAHVTLGFATLDDLKTIETEPFNEFDIDPANIAVFHLGNNGTARKELKSFTF